MKQNLLKTIALGLMAMVGVNAWAGDFIDDATTIKVASSEVTPNSGTKKSLTFTPTGNDVAIEFTFSSGKSVTPGQIYGVIEYSGTGSALNKCRFRNFTFGTTEIEDGAAADNLNFTVNSNTVVICPFLQKDNGTEAKVIKTYYKNNVDESSLNLKYARVYAGTTASTECTVTRIGIYTLGEILELYPDLKAKNWQISDMYQLKNGNCTAVATAITASATNNSTDNGVIETNSANITTLAGCKLWIKSLGVAKISSNYRYIHMRYLVPDAATNEDLFKGLHDNAIVMLGFSNGAIERMPTMHKKVVDWDAKMKAWTFVDGISPSEVSAIALKDGQTANWATYSRELKAGYNSCLMPFKKLDHTTYLSSGISFYKLAETPIVDGKVIFTKVADPTGSTTFTNGSNWYPVIIKAETAGVYTFVGRDAVLSDNVLSGYSGYKQSTIESNLYWVGSFVEEAPMASGNAYNGYTACYGISTDGSDIKKMKANTKTTYYRAFLADNRPASAPALSLGFDDGNGTTDIKRVEDIDGLETISGGAIYNLQGVRMNGDNLPRGIYVRNGKKFVVK